MANSPTSRTLKLLRKEGMIVEVVEHWNPFSYTRKDLFGFIDLIAMNKEKKETWGIQCTSTGNMNARVKKICEECKENAKTWLEVGNHIEVIGWAKRGVKGKGKRKTYQVSRRVITLEDITQNGSPEVKK